MGKKARSARGVVVDFDLMKIKEQMASAPTPLEVKTRQNFIENRLKRRLKKPALPKVESAEVKAEPDMPEPAASADESHIEDVAKLVEVDETDEVIAAPKKKVTRQKARSTKK